MGNLKYNKICVLLASYNGERFIANQLVSIAEQKDIRVSVLISDDGSTDNTLGEIGRLKTQLLNCEIDLIKNDGNEKSHLSNFSALCALALTREENYFAFSDQDDDWTRDKLAKLQTRMVELETKYGVDMPIMIHTDLRVVDEELNEIAPSYIKYQAIPDPTQHEFPTFCFQNVVTGCTVLFNRSLLQQASPIPQNAIVHDWWFAQCAMLCGVLDFYDEPLVNYRQHDDNAIGAIANAEQVSYFKKHLYKALLDYPAHLSLSIEQAKSLTILYEGLHPAAVDNSSAAAIKVFASLKEAPLLNRLKYAHQYFAKKQYLERFFMYFSYAIVKYL